MLCPARYPRSRSPWAMGSKEANPNELDSSDKYPTLGTFIGGCASAARGTASRLRMSMTIHPTVLHHMIVSSRQLHADLLLSMEAERYASGAAESGSAADAVSRRLHAVLGAGEGRDTVLTRLLHGPGASLCPRPRTSVTSLVGEIAAPFPAPQAPPPLSLQLLLQLVEKAPVRALGN